MYQAVPDQIQSLMYLSTREKFKPIIELVDSNIGIARTRIYDNILKSLQISKNRELISLYDNILFIFKCFHDQQGSQWREKASRKYPTKQQQNGQIVFLLQTGQLNTASTSCAGLHTKQQHFLLSSARAHRFFTTSKSRKVHVATHLNTTASNLGRHFLYLYLRMHT